MLAYKYIAYARGENRRKKNDNQANSIGLNKAE